MITIHTITIDELDMTIRIAKQLPIKSFSARWDESTDYKTQSPIICRITEKTINPHASENSYLGLVEYPGGELAWVHPLLPDSKMARMLEGKGMWYDNLSSPLVILK